MALPLMPSPDASSFASQWNIGFSLLCHSEFRAYIYAHMKAGPAEGVNAEPMSVQKSAEGTLTQLPCASSR